MTIGKHIASFFRLQNSAWERHANPWSVWSRLTVLPALILAVWSRVWIGWWALVPGVLAILWTALNPHLFDAPDSFDTWASQSVLGEKHWIHRDETPIPEHHRVVPHLLNTGSGIGMLVVAWGVIDLALWPTLTGATLVYAGKLWFLDRMVWLYEDMETASGP